MNPLLVSLQFATPREIRSDSRYYWDSRKRGKDRYLIFQYTWSGCGMFHDGRREIPIPAGHGLFTASVDSSAYYYPPAATEPWVFGWLSLVGAEQSWKWLRQSFGSVVALSSSGTAISTFREITLHYHRRSFQDHFQASELLFGFIMEVFRELTASPERKDSSIHYARNYIDDNHQRPLGMKELADMVGMSREHFSRLFRATLGQSPGTYLRERRLQTAELMLRQSTESIGTIGRNSGFASTSHFCRAFRAKRGRSPENFRRQ